jgi:hypothetical protein
LVTLSVLPLLAWPLYPIRIEAKPIEWNYFGDCFSDDSIYAADGKWWYFDLARNVMEWVFGGTYREVSDGVIAIVTKEGQVGGTYIHRNFLSKKCYR